MLVCIIYNMFSSVKTTTHQSQPSSYLTFKNSPGALLNPVGRVLPLACAGANTAHAVCLDRSHLLLNPPQSLRSPHWFGGVGCFLPFSFY